MSIAENLSVIHERMDRACARAGRDPEHVALMAVTKTQPADRIVEAYKAGHRLFGENRVQEFEGKIGGLTQMPDAEFHMIGHLQSNKAAKAAEVFHAIDSLDSAKLGERLNAAAAKLGKTLAVMIEINIGGEDAKSGIAPDSPELEQILSSAGAPSFSPSSGERVGLLKWPHLRVQGLMTVPPFTENPEGARMYFRRLRELRDRLAARRSPAIALEQLSMGMSHDFEVAIEEGSTCVRVGTAIFGERAKR